MSMVTGLEDGLSELVSGGCTTAVELLVIYAGEGLILAYKE